MDDYLCLILLSRRGETARDFKVRLSAFWTHLLRQEQALFERVYAETTEFETEGSWLKQKYLVEANAIRELEVHLRAERMEFEPIDEADLYSKFEAAPPDWFWIEH